MAIKPILFNTEMVRAILDGRKTCTRRLIRKHIENKYLEYDEWVRAVAPPGSTCLREKEFYEQYPPYQLGDTLYVRETWSEGYEEGTYIYMADDKLVDLPAFKESSKLIYHPSIHMPKEAARIWLKVTDVRVERLQDITPKGAESEGVGNLFYDDIGYGEKNYGTEVDQEYGIAKEQFAWLWESTIKKSDLDRYGWDANPYVWVIKFERCEKPAESPYAWNDAIDKLTKGV